MGEDVVGWVEGWGDSIWLRNDKKAGRGFRRTDPKVEEADQRLFLNSVF